MISSVLYFWLAWPRRMSFSLKKKINIIQMAPDSSKTGRRKRQNREVKAKCVNKGKTLKKNLSWLPICRKDWQLSKKTCTRC